jgi:hypothetical protein
MLRVPRLPPGEWGKLSATVVPTDGALVGVNIRLVVPYECTSNVPTTLKVERATRGMVQGEPLTEKKLLAATPTMLTDSSTLPAGGMLLGAVTTTLLRSTLANEVTTRCEGVTVQSP